jgi:hypothetical protein
MATSPIDDSIDVREQITRIDKMQAEMQKLNADTLKVLQDTSLAKPQLMFQGALAMAAMIASVAALAKLFY